MILVCRRKKAAAAQASKDIPMTDTPETNAPEAEIPVEDIPVSEDVTDTVTSGVDSE